MIHYWDTSALVKLVLQEEGTATASAVHRSASFGATCRLAYVEATSAVARAVRADRLSVEGAEEARAAFRHLWSDMILAEVDQALVEHAGQLAERHALRGHDATHLAAAARMRAVAAGVVFVTWDRTLAGAAAAEHMPVIPG